MSDLWTMFTKRTNDPKLAWLERRLDLAQIPHRRNGESFHAPILEVGTGWVRQASRILDEYDEIPDDDPMFCGFRPYTVEPRDGRFVVLDAAGDVVETFPCYFEALRRARL